MSRLKIAEVSQDRLMQALGKSKIVDLYGFGKSRIANNQNASLKVSFLEKQLKDDGLLYAEVSTIRLEPTNASVNFQNLVRKNVSLNVPITDHYITLQKPSFAPEVASENLNKTIASYDLMTNFNYISEDYDSMQSAFPEWELPSIVSPPTKREFLDFRTKDAKAPFNSTANRNQFKNFVLPNEGPRKKRSLDSTQALGSFPYYNQIKITNKVVNKFSSFLNELSIFDPILSSYLQSPKSNLSFNVQDGTSVTQNTQISTFNLLNWAQTEGNDVLSNYFALDPDGNNQSDMIVNYKKLMFAGYVRALSKGSFRSFEEICNNEECYREDFVYSVDKYKNVIAGNPSQRLFVPAIDDISILNDTQVKYGQTYAYRCDAHYIIVGNSYQYSDLKFWNEDGVEYATLKVTNTPNIIIVPIGMFESNITVIQPPPIYPQVKFVTENNSNNKIDIYLSPTKGEIIERFIPIVAADEENYHILTENLKVNTDQVRFRSMPEDGLYQIFKMSTPPKDITDFKNKLLTEIRMPYESNDALYKDTVLANTKYYYMFRKLNSKNVPSNPTAIYEIELLKDADDSKVVVKEYHPPKPLKSQDSLKFRSLFQITPAVEQLIFNEEQDYLFGKRSLKGTIDNLKLGTAEKSVWGRKFKFRIKSTTSGKIIDYNVTFTLTKNKTEEDF
tara:strand:+ start:8435 stop:10453 length:2019 start_codon:yes stop_codon:yes gene_type:complete